ncbi:MAG: hypothetical protein E7256_01490 [Lachnospiraceae bacterium]|nr:hypothetical protein [Lachnospiraceae bacterium]
MNRQRPYFEGWYFRHQKDDNVISIIPGAQIDEEGNASAFVQVITKDASYYISYPMECYYVNRKVFFIKVGPNWFTRRVIYLSIHTKELDLEGEIRYGKFEGLHYDIMGPFRFIPFMPCRHQIISMRHSLNGRISLNGQEITFSGGNGYIEGDSGHTFPNDYFWSQCNHFSKEQAAIFAAAADIPVFGVWIPGCIAIVNYRGKELRFATYLGARVRIRTEHTLLITQGAYALRIRVAPKQGQILKAPIKGRMRGRVKECVQCRACYELFYNKKRVFRLVSGTAGFERVTSL